MGAASGASRSKGKVSKSQLRVSPATWPTRERRTHPNWVPRSDARPARPAASSNGTAATTRCTRQRIHQSLVVLWTRGLIRSIDADHPSFVIARTDDFSTLLTAMQERLLSAFPEATPTTISKAAHAAKMSVSKAREHTEHLQEQGLIETVGKLGASELYKLTLAGLAHWQRNPAARRAEPPQPSVRSERVFRLLSHLETQGPNRI